MASCLWLLLKITWCVEKLPLTRLYWCSTFYHQHKVLSSSSKGLWHTFFLLSSTVASDEFCPIWRDGGDKSCVCLCSGPSPQSPRTWTFIGLLLAWLRCNSKTEQFLFLRSHHDTDVTELLGCFTCGQTDADWLYGSRPADIWEARLPRNAGGAVSGDRIPNVAAVEARGLCGHTLTLISVTGMSSQSQNLPRTSNQVIQAWFVIVVFYHSAIHVNRKMIIPNTNRISKASILDMILWPVSMIV